PHGGGQGDQGGPGPADVVPAGNAPARGGRGRDGAAGGGGAPQGLVEGRLLLARREGGPSALDGLAQRPREDARAGRQAGTARRGGAFLQGHRAAGHGWVEPVP